MGFCGGEICRLGVVSVCTRGGVRSDLTRGGFCRSCAVATSPSFSPPQCLLAGGPAIDFHARPRLDPDKHRLSNKPDYT